MSTLQDPTSQSATRRPAATPSSLSSRRRSRRILTHIAIILIAFAAGTCAGLLVYPDWLGTGDVVVDSATDDAHGPHHGEEIVQLTPQAAANLNLEMGVVQLGDYLKTQAFPGEVVEIEGQSDITISSPLTGTIERVEVRAGESVTGADALFQLRITDQLLLQSQADLLALVSQVEIAQAKLERLTPLADDGTISGNRKRELQYELTSLQSRIETEEQRILARGLPPDRLEIVRSTRKLATRIPIHIPAEFPRTVEDPDFSVGAIHCHPGMAVVAGAELCRLTMHDQLFLKGQAFEADLESITQLTESDWGVTAEFGHQHHGDHKHSTVRRGLRVARIDNHVDPETQTFSFFLPLENEVVQEISNDGRLYRQWRFRPGQRAHLKVPTDQQTGKIRLPLAAVAIEGPNAIVFRKHSHGPPVVSSAGAVGLAAGVGLEFDDSALGDGHDDDSAEHAHDDDHDHDAGSHAAHDDHDHGEDDHNHGEDDHDHGEDLELEPVPVHVLSRDHQYVIIAPHEELQVGDEVAMNSAHKLHLALKMNAGGGGGHGHEH